MNFLTCICHIPLLAIYSHCNHLEYHRKLLCANFNLCHLGTCPTKFGSNRSSQFQEKNFKESAKYSTLGDYAASKDPMNKFGNNKLNGYTSTFYIPNQLINLYQSFSTICYLKAVILGAPGSWLEQTVNYSV